MSDSMMNVGQSHEDAQLPTEETQQKDSLQTVTTGLGVVSGGLAGAMIGRLVAGRFGAVVGAVIGGVAGGTAAREADHHQIADVAKSIQQNVQKTVGEIGASEEVASEDTEQPSQMSEREDVVPAIATSTEQLNEDVQSVESSVSTADITSSSGSWNTTTDEPGVEVGMTERTKPIIESELPTDMGEATMIDQPDVPQSVSQPMSSTGSVDGAVGDQSDFGTVQVAFERGMRLSHQGELDEAERAFREAIDLMPDLPEAHFNLGIVLLQLNRKTEGLSCIRQARDLSDSQGDSASVENLDRILQQAEMVS